MLKRVEILARDLADAWYQAVNLVQDEGHIYTITKGSYEGQKRWEFDYITIQITHPGARPLVPDLPPGMPFPPPTSMDAVKEYLPYLMTNARQPNETYTYGERLFGRDVDLVVENSLPKPACSEFLGTCRTALVNRPDKPVYPSIDFIQKADGLWIRAIEGKNQIQTVIEMFKEAGEGCNQATMEIAQPNDCGTVDPPCLRLIDCRLRYGALHFIVYFRSWDLWSGFPVNLASLQLLKEYMSSEIGCDDGEMVAASKGLHLYDHAWDLAKMRTYRTKTEPIEGE